MCLWGLQRAVPAHRGPGGGGGRLLPGGWLMCVIEMRSFPFREHLGSRTFVPLGMPVRAHGEWRGILYIRSSCVSYLLLYLSALFSLTNMVLRYIHSLPVLSAAIRAWSKEDWENPIFLGLSLFTILVCLLFLLLFPFSFLFKNFCLLLCMRPAFLFPSSLPFYCF